MARNNPKPPITANNVFRLHVHGQCYGQATINRFDFFFGCRVFTPSGLPQGETGGRPPELLPSPPPSG